MTLGHHTPLSNNTTAQMNEELQRELLQRLKPLRELLDRGMDIENEAESLAHEAVQPLGQERRPTQSERMPARPDNDVSFSFKCYSKLTRY